MISELSTEYHTLTNQIEQAEAALKKLKAEKAKLGELLRDAMLEQGMKSAKFDYGTFTIVSTHHTNVLVADEPDVISWAKDAELPWVEEHLDKKALKEFVESLPVGEDGRPLLPPAIAEKVNVYTQTVVRLTRS